MQGILISVRHKWAEKIYRKEKLFELRKTAPRCAEFLAQPWRPVYIYEPEKRAVTGVAGFGGEVSSRAAERIAMLPLSLSEEAVNDYGPGRDGLYHAWRLEGAERYLDPFPLWEFFDPRSFPHVEGSISQRNIPKRPPQSWRYIRFERGRS